MSTFNCPPYVNMVQSFAMQTLLLLISLYLSPQSSRAAVDPAITWRMRDTEHFTLIYDAKQEELGRLYATYAEQAYQSTVGVFGEAPRMKTVLVLNDVSDAANGSATPIPYPLIDLFPVLPGARETIGDYSNWGLELLTHEYAHILNFTPAHGFFRPLRWAFGSVVVPGALLPRWYLEGTAVEIETRLSTHGRLRSPLAMATFRAMSLDGTLLKESLARADDTANPAWPSSPFAGRPYLFGSLMIQEIAKEKGSPALAELNQRYSRRVPYFINGPVQDLLDLNYTQIFENILARLDLDTREVSSRIAAGGEHPVETLKQSGVDHRSPRISPDGRHLAFIEYDPDRLYRLVVVERSESAFTGQARQSKSRFQGVHKLSWLPNSEGVIFDASDVVRRYAHFSDLYRWNIETQKVRRLTYGMRAVEPAVSPDGEWIVFRQNTELGARLARVRVDGTALEPVYTPAPQVRVASPEFLSNTRIVFSERGSGGHEVLKILNLDQGTTVTVLPEFDPIQVPRPLKDGRVVFSSSRTGVGNIYLASADFKSARALTNTKTYAAEPEVDPQTGDLYFTGMTGAGFQIQRVAGRHLATPVQPPQVDLKGSWPDFNEPQVTAQGESRPYSPWPYLYPRYWIPMIYAIEGGWLVEASTSAHDPLQKHAYMLQANYNSVIEKPSFGVSYTNTQTPVSTQIIYQSTYQYLYSTKTELYNNLVSIVGAVPLALSWLSSFNLRAGFGFVQSEIPDFISAPDDVYSSKRTGPMVELSYSNETQFGYQISPESGGSAQWRSRAFIGAGENYEAYSQHKLTGRYHVSRFLPEHHVLMGQITAIAQPGLKTDLLALPSSSMVASGSSLLTQEYLVRGYSGGELLGRHVLNATLEYRFPIWSVYQGSGTLPLFYRRLHGAVVADAASVEGVYFNWPLAKYKPTSLGQVFASSGLELRSEITIGYHLPVTLTLGFYQAFRSEARDAPWSFNLSFGL